jgi:hypothetical protein
MLCAQIYSLSSGSAMPFTLFWKFMALCSNVTFKQIFFVLLQMEKYHDEIIYIQKMTKVYESYLIKPNDSLPAPDDEKVRDFPDTQHLHPLQMGPLACPLHNVPLLDSGKWTDYSDSSYPPRLLFGLKKNIWLISRLYQCPLCVKPYPAHDIGIMRQIKSHINIILYHRCGCTLAFFAAIINSTETGTEYV